MQTPILLSMLAAGGAFRLESVVSRAASQVQAEFGSNFSVIEAFACATYLCEGRVPMQTATAARFMRIVFTHPHETTPNIEAAANISVSRVAVELRMHTQPFLQDNATGSFPPKSNISFEDAFVALKARLPERAAWQVSFRRPLHPCASEDLFQMSLTGATGSGSEILVASLGVQTGKLCKGFITQHVALPICGAPDCWGA